MNEERLAGTLAPPDFKFGLQISDFGFRNDAARTDSAKSRAGCSPYHANFKKRTPRRCVPTLRSECEQHLGPQETHHVLVGVIISHPDAFGPQMGADMVVEFVFEDGLQVMAPEMATVAEQRGVDLAGRRAFGGEQRVVGGAEGCVLHGGESPIGTKAHDIVHLGNLFASVV